MLLAMAGSAAWPFYLSLKVGVQSPFFARVFRVADAGRVLETQLASLEDVSGFLSAMRPVAWIDEVRWTEQPVPGFLVVSRPPEPLGALVKRALTRLDVRESSEGHADLMLADKEEESLRQHFSAWKSTHLPPLKS
jgi:hypothetical protein